MARPHTVWMRAIAAHGGRAVGQPCTVLLPNLATRPRAQRGAAGILRRVLRQPEADDPAVRAMALAQVLGRLADAFGQEAALNLLYIHCLSRPMEPPAIGERIAHLELTDGDFTSIVADVLASEEMTRLYGADKLAGLPPDRALTAWLDLAVPP